MTAKQVSFQRLTNQRISRGDYSDPADIVHWMGAIQAQDYAMAKWAIGCRLKKSTDAKIESAFNSGKILRTHVLRPTWHFVSPEDIHWMLKLTAPGIKAFAKNYHKRLEIDSAILKKSKRIIETALATNGSLTRKEMQAHLSKASIKTDETRMSFLLIDAEVEGLICSAGRKGKQFAYGLLDAIVPKHKSLTQQEALAELAHRYIASHGPATADDFSWWSGLSLTEARKAIEMQKDQFNSEKTGSSTFWFCDRGAVGKTSPTAIYLLPAYDEFMISYKSREMSIESERLKSVLTINGIFKPTIVVNGQVRGIWRRNINKGELAVEMDMFHPAEQPGNAALKKAIERYRSFYNFD